METKEKLYYIQNKITKLYVACQSDDPDTCDKSEAAQYTKSGGEEIIKYFDNEYELISV